MDGVSFLFNYVTSMKLLHALLPVAAAALLACTEPEPGNEDADGFTFSLGASLMENKVYASAGGIQLPPHGTVVWFDYLFRLHAGPNGDTLEAVRLVPGPSGAGYALLTRDARAYIHAPNLGADQNGWHDDCTVTGSLKAAAPSRTVKLSAPMEPFGLFVESCDRGQCTPLDTMWVLRFQHAAPKGASSEEWNGLEVQGTGVLSCDD